MKSTPLVLKIWLVFASITLCLFILLAFSLPWTLKGFFTEQIYDILLDSQKAVPKDVIRIQLSPQHTVPLPPLSVSKPSSISSRATINPALPFDMDVTKDPNELNRKYVTEKINDSTMQATTTFRIAPSGNGPGIQHVVITEQGIPAKLADSIPPPFVQAIEQDAENQKELTQTYTLNIKERTMFYVISKEQIEGNTGYMISYAWGNYRNDLIMTMFWRLVLLMIVLIVISWLPCLWLARYISLPLVLIEQQAGRMAERDWHEPFVLNRSDEMGRLAKAIESMRQRLVRQDKAQQFFLQNISHELKTPVMVIHSYAQSILDGIYPKGTVAASIETIMSEATRLEKRVKDLLYLNKLNYLSDREGNIRSFDLSMIIGDCIERLRFRRTELTWTTDMSPLLLEGDPEQWSVAIENILDNQLRYAHGKITVTFELQATDTLPYRDGTKGWTVRIWNDGPAIQEELLEHIFDQFQTGPDGQFGLGLAITQQILTSHKASIRACNEHEGVAFYLEPRTAS
jgi:two-component system sensor histidine kinase CssS